MDDHEELPDDVGGHAAGIAELLARIPADHARRIDCGSGWYPILADLDAALAAIDPAYELHAAAEKYGTLRVDFLTSQTDRQSAMQALIDDAETRSEATCELCGEPGRLHVSDGWFKTLCSACATARGYAPDHEPLPADAGDHAEGLRRLLARVPANRRPALSISPGWYGIVVELDATLAAIDAGYEVHQIKEKFGGLRFYASHSDGAGEDQAGAFDELIRAAEKRCATTCEVCAQPGRLHKNRHGGVRTLCADCAAAQPGKFKPWPGS